MEILDIERQDDPSSSRPVGVPSSYAYGRDKGVTEDDYETGSDLDTDEVWMMSKGFT